MTPRPPAAPKGSGPAGKRLWKSIVEVLDLDEHERVLLVEAVRTVDLLEDLDDRVKRGGVLVMGKDGMKANPAAVEARQQRIALARLLAALRLPAGLAPGEAREAAAVKAPERPQRRVGARGVYAITGGKAASR